MENWLPIVSIIVGIIGGIRGFIQFFLKQKQQEKIEKLKSELEQNKLNDEKFRKSYQDFIHLLFAVLNKEKVDADKGIIEFMKAALLFAGPNTITQFGMYRKTAGDKSTKNILINMGELILAMRKDLGVSNDGITRKDILQSIIVGDIEEMINKDS